MKTVGTIILLTCFVSFTAAAVEAGWLINEERFHVSVHGQISCQDCHDQREAGQSHPNPQNVNKGLKDFFYIEQCTDCHEEVMDEIGAGSHGGETVENPQDYQLCISCHHPHYQEASTEASADKVDLTQPAEKKCSLCHDFQAKLPELSSEDERCMACHRLVSSDDPEAAQKMAQFCFHCHGSKNQIEPSETQVNVALINVTDYKSVPHSKEACTVCHLKAAEYKHADQTLGDCRQCHLRHDEKKAHDAHINVTCEACHLNMIQPRKNAETQKVNWQIKRQPGALSRVHHMVRAGDNDEACLRCHTKDNTVGAAAMVLPAKSVLCMPCHAATFSVGDTTTILALILFFFGQLSLMSIWMSGSIGQQQPISLGQKLSKLLDSAMGALLSARIIGITRALVVDGLFQRRLFQVSPLRWALHALIFFPFVFRFGWGVVALLGTLWAAEQSWPWVMVDKNHPIGAFLFDLSGVLILLGAGLMIVRKTLLKSDQKPAGLPKPDWLAIGLLAGIIVIGFVLEAMRIAMTGSPEGSQYAFIGHAISYLFQGTNVTAIYGYVWYVHAILTGAFVAHLPFSRMLHIIMAPVALAIKAAHKNH